MRWLPAAKPTDEQRQAFSLKLAPLQRKLAVVLFATRDLAAVLALFERVRLAPFTLSAYEFFTAECVARFYVGK